MKKTLAFPFSFFSSIFNKMSFFIRYCFCVIGYCLVVPIATNHMESISCRFLLDHFCKPGCSSFLSRYTEHFQHHDYTVALGEVWVLFHSLGMIRQAQYWHRVKRASPKSLAEVDWIAFQGVCLHPLIVNQPSAICLLI